MEKISFDIPMMYGDHHTMEVRRILFELAGVKEVNASSCFHKVEVQFDPAVLVPEMIEKRLAEAGYLRELSLPDEVLKTGRSTRSTRNEILYPQSNQVVTFAQNVSNGNASRWPCPGLGVIGEADKEQV